MIVVIDYGMGNLRSVQKALEASGAKAIITQNPKDIQKADRVVLPGVGAMQPSMEKLEALGLIDAIKQAIKSGKPFLGICLGLQLLFDSSDEGGAVKGLGILPGAVIKFSSLKVPHMGWNQLVLKKEDCPLFAKVEPKANVYFCHSYFGKPAKPGIIATTTEYGITFASSVWKDNVFAVQFHPEKSQTTGLQILKNFTKLKI